MDTTEAAAVLRSYLEAYRARSHAALQQLLLAPVADEVIAPSGRRYQVMVQARWTGAPGGPLHVVGGIDDAGWQRFTPLMQSFDAVPGERAAAPAAGRQRAGAQ